MSRMLPLMPPVSWCPPALLQLAGCAPAGEAGVGVRRAPTAGIPHMLTQTVDLDSTLLPRNQWARPPAPPVINSLYR